MRAVVQKVKSASVSYNDSIFEIGRGVVVFLAIGKGDTEENVTWLAKKVVNLRIFENETGKMDYSVLDINGEIMIVSEFTLYGDCNKGNRPDFTSAEKPEIAVKLYEKFVEEIKKYTSKVKTGQFRSYMLVNLTNDGPVTLILDSNN